MKIKYIRFGFAGILALIIASITGCEKFTDPGLDQEIYKPDSTNIYADKRRRVLLIGIDGLSSDAVQAIKPAVLNSLLSNAKYAWNIIPLVTTGSEKDVTSNGTLSVRVENGSGAGFVEGSSKLVDGLYNTMYSCGPITSFLPNLWFQLRFSVSPGTVIESYTMTSGTGTVTVRDPKSWTFEGSANGSSWTVLDKQVNQTFSARSQTKKYSFENRTAYQYYRVVVSEIFDITQTGYFQQAEWRVLQNTYLTGMNAASWTSFMTGNSRTIHTVSDSSFYAKPADTTNTIPVSPNLTAIRMIHDYNVNTRAVAVSAWGNLINTLLKDADKRVVTTNDEDTKNKTVELLKADSAQLFIAQFGDVYNARLQSGSTDSSPQFVTAVNKTDAYIKELLDAIKSRSNYNGEEWLVLITSTQGGTGLGIPVDLKPGFLIAYNPIFKSQDLSKMNPAITVHQEDVARQLLYWLKVPGNSAIQTGSLWLDRFGVEFIK